MLVFFTTLPEVVSQGLQTQAFEVLLFDFFIKKKWLGLLSPTGQTENIYPLTKELLF